MKPAARKVSRADPGWPLPRRWIRPPPEAGRQRAARDADAGQFAPKPLLRSTPLLVVTSQLPAAEARGGDWLSSSVTRKTASWAGCPRSRAPAATPSCRSPAPPGVAGRQPVADDRDHEPRLPAVVEVPQVDDHAGVVARAVRDVEPHEEPSASGSRSQARLSAQYSVCRPDGRRPPRVLMVSTLNRTAWRSPPCPAGPPAVARPQVHHPEVDPPAGRLLRRGGRRAEPRDVVRVVAVVRRAARLGVGLGRRVRRRDRRLRLGRRRAGGRRQDRERGREGDRRGEAAGSGPGYATQGARSLQPGMRPASQPGSRSRDRTPARPPINAPPPTRAARRGRGGESRRGARRGPHERRVHLRPPVRLAVQRRGAGRPAVRAPARAWAPRVNCVSAPT